MTKKIHTGTVKLFDKWDELNEEFSSSKRTIYLETLIDASTISFFQQRVSLICEITGNDKDPITIELTTMGGEAFALLGLVDIIRMQPMKINVFARGCAFSSGAVILAAGTGTRAMTTNSYAMLHSASGGFSGTTDDIEIEAENIKDLTRRIYTLLGTFTKKPASFWEKNCKKNLYLTPDKCLEYGIIDIII